MISITKEQGDALRAVAREAPFPFAPIAQRVNGSGLEFCERPEDARTIESYLASLPDHHPSKLFGSPLRSLAAAIDKASSDALDAEEVSSDALDARDAEEIRSEALDALDAEEVSSDALDARDAQERESL